MSGIAKINALSNLGIFENFVWPTSPEDIYFKKLNFLYGYNGSGKTTLSHILSLFSDELSEEESTVLLNDLKSDQQKEEAINIQWDNKTIKSFKEKKKIFVFNSSFIASHVYNGTQSNVKLFKSGVITNEQLSNPDIKNLTKQIEDKTLELKKVNDSNAAIKELAESIKTELSKRWNEAIQGSRMPTNLNLENCPNQAPKETEEDLENKLKDNFRRYSLSKDQTILTTDIGNLTSLVFQEVSLAENYSALLNKSIPASAREKVRNKIEALKEIKLVHNSHQNWFEDGVILLKNIPNTSQCPLCNSEIENIDNLLTEYNSYFSDELSTLLKSLNKAVADIQSGHTSIENNRMALATINTLVAKYDSGNLITEEYRNSIEFITKAEIQGTLRIVEMLLTKKKDDIEAKFSDEDFKELEILTPLLLQYNQNLANIVKIKDMLIKDMKGNAFDASITREICKNLFWSKFNKQAEIHENEYNKKLELSVSTELKGGIEFNKRLKIQESQLSTAIQGFETQRAQKLAQFKKESKYINDFLRRLCVSNFTVDVSDGKEGFKVIYKNGRQKKGVKNSLSEGEKTALAFAYFLSKYQFEIKDNLQINESECIIILDDPVSSLDENRLYSTALVIRDILLPKAKNKEQTDWEGCKQSFVFSHNLIFLKFIGNIVNHKNQYREDFYLENGVLQKLPRNLDNYHTSYFYRLERIQSFCSNNAKYDEIKDSLPNSIRIVLEAFLSFKFGRLKGKKYPSPSLEELVGHLSWHNFDKFTAVGDIQDRDTLQNILYQICKVVNPESHGTPQDVTLIEYLPESELKDVSLKTLNVIEFLDQMHFKAAQDLTSTAVA
jgi:wobble nucleotide-excising tRNase